MTKKQSVQDLRDLAEVMGGNLVVANFSAVDASDGEAVNVVDAEIFKADNNDLPGPTSSTAPADSWLALLRPRGAVSGPP